MVAAAASKARMTRYHRADSGAIPSLHKIAKMTLFARLCNHDKPAGDQPAICSLCREV